MNAKIYEILAILTSSFIIVCSLIIFFQFPNLKFLAIFLLFSGIFSILMRSYRYLNDKCGVFCNHPLFYADVAFAFLSLFILLSTPISLNIKYFAILAFIFMILGAVIPHLNYPISAYYFHLLGHLIICLVLLLIILRSLKCFPK